MLEIVRITFDRVRRQSCSYILSIGVFIKLFAAVQVPVCRPSHIIIINICCMQPCEKRTAICAIIYTIIIEFYHQCSQEFQRQIVLNWQIYYFTDRTILLFRWCLTIMKLQTTIRHAYHLVRNQAIIKSVFHYVLYIFKQKFVLFNITVSFKIVTAD